MATRTIKTRLEISGDQEYREKLKKVNTELSEQKSQLKLLSEQYKNNQNSQEALSKKVEQLRNVQQAQIKVIDAAKQGVENATKEYTKYENIIKDLEEKIQKTQIEQENINASTRDGAKRQEELNEEIKRYQEQIAEATKKQDIAAAGMDDWAIKQSKAQTALNRTSAQITEYERYLEEANNSTDKCAESIDQYGKKVKKAGEEHKEFDGRLDSSEAAIGSLAAALAATGLTKSAKEIAGALMDCVNAATEFESALAKVNTIADTSAVSMDTIKKDIINLSNETGQAVTELSEATYNAISASVDTAGAVEFVGTATKLATGGFTDNTTAVDILTTVLNAYNMELEQAREVSDYLITTQNLGKTTVNELASSMGKVIPVAATYNVEMSNLSSAMAILTSKGIATAESTTYMKAALNELGDSGSIVSKTLVEQTGMSFANLMKQGYSLGDVMEILGKAVDNDRGAFNELWSSQEAGIAALSLLATGSKQYNEVLAKMKESAGATSEAYAKMANTAEMSQKKLSNAFFNLKVATGNEIQDQLSGIYDKGTDLLTWAADFIEENEWLIPVLEGLTIGLGVATAAITGYTIVTEIAIPLIKSFNSALSANPVGLVTTAIVGLIAVLSPFIVEMSNAKTEVEQQAEAWRDQADALNEAVDAYKNQNEEAQKAGESTRELADSLTDLISKENKSEAEKQAIAEITDKLNEKIPNLGLKYDDLSDSINMTTQELDAMLDAMERQERYENAKSNYASVYAKKKESVEALTGAQDKLAEATERLEEIASVSELEFDKREYKKAADEVNNCAEAVDELQRAVSESNSALAAMTYDTNIYTIETALMTDAERDAIDAMMEAAEAKHGYLPAYYDEIEAIAQTAQEYNTYANEVKAHTETVIQQIQELQAKYQESYLTAYDNIQSQIGLFSEMKVESSKSIDEMISSLGSQIDYMNEYAENMRLAMDAGVNEGILKQLADGSTESAAILQEIVNSGQEKIEELNEEFAKVSEGKEEFSTAIAELETYYGEELDKLVEDTSNAVKEMARYDDAYKAAVETCNGIKAGIDANWNSVMEKYKELSRAAMNAYKEEQDTHSPSKKFIWMSEMSMEGIEKGVDNRKEDVLNKYRNMSREIMETYRKSMEEMKSRSFYIGIAERQNAMVHEYYMNNASGTDKPSSVTNTTTQTFNIYQPVKSPSELMRAARLEQQYGMAGD